MHVVVLNESTKAALVRSRRVLSKYLPQLGSSTWAGAISEEGLKDLREALKAVSSKTMSVSCLRLQGRGRLEPLWVVGSKGAFDDSGRYAFRQLKAQHDVQPPARARTPLERFLMAVLRLSGLAHDTGKASKAFRAKLRKGKGAEAIRHELLSFLVIAESLWKPGVTDGAWLARVRDNPRELVACVRAGGKQQVLLPESSEFLQRIRKAFDSQRSALEEQAETGQPGAAATCLVKGSEIEELFQSAPGLCLLLWLVLTHHRLPGSDQTAQAWWAGKHIHLPESLKEVHVASLEDCLVTDSAHAPWSDDAWCKAVSSAAGAALAALAELPPQELALPKEEWALLGAHLLRPSLILADHLGSTRAVKSFRKTDTVAKEIVFANTVGPDVYGDTLAVHEIKVAQLTRKALHLAERVWPSTTLPPTSLSVVRDLKPPFAWQMDLEDACNKAREAGPVFVCVIAETGAGKTLAGLRAAHALGKGALRLTMALGLRSLTKQSAVSAVEDAQLDEDALVVSVGNPQTLALAEAFEKSYALGQARRFGSESAEGEDADVSLATTAEPDLSWLEGFCTENEAPELWGQKNLAMLSAPVLACTADHLVRSATMLRGGDAKLYLRLASSDLLLDEIDAYSATDMQSIAKLAFVSGLHGKNVVIMSATVTPQVQAGLYQAWSKGVEVGSRYRGEVPTHACVFSSNTVPSEVHVAQSTALDEAPWSAYAGRVASVYEQLRQQKARRKLDLVSIDDCKGHEDAYEVMLGAVAQLHSAHSVLDPETGIRVSTGFVRFNTAGQAWQFSHYLAHRQSSEGPEIRFITYHSKFPRTYLGVLDSVLSQLTKRKDPLAFLQTPALRQALSTCKSQDFVLVVCTTTLIETGRDFDFDWGMLEPRSNRGDVQAAGRTLRHRRDVCVSSPNILMLSRPLRAIGIGEEQGAKDLPMLWGMPGVEDDFSGRRLRVTYQLPAMFSTVSVLPKKGPLLRALPGAAKPKQGPVVSAQDALPVQVWRQGIDASLCLTSAVSYESNRIGFLEQKAQELNLKGSLFWEGKAGGIPSMSFYLHTLAPLNAVHALETPFRGKRQGQLTFIPHNGEVWFFDEKEFGLTRSKKRRPAPGVEWVVVPGHNALLPNLESLAAPLYTGTDHHVDGCALRCPIEQGPGKKAQWSPLLGFRE